LSVVGLPHYFNGCDEGSLTLRKPATESGYSRGGYRFIAFDGNAAFTEINNQNGGCYALANQSGGHIDGYAYGAPAPVACDQVAHRADSQSQAVNRYGLVDCEVCACSKTQMRSRVRGCKRNDQAGLAIGQSADGLQQ
jgi:hypothetical protein